VRKLRCQVTKKRETKVIGPLTSDGKKNVDGLTGKPTKEIEEGEKNHAVTH